MDKMKKALMIVAIVALVAIAGSTIYYFVFFKPGIAKAELKIQEAQQKQKIKKNITTYDLTTKDRLVLNALVKNDTFSKFGYNTEDLLADIVNMKFDFGQLDDNIRKDLIKNSYSASEIINYSKTDVRFIDFDTNKEKTIHAGYISIN
ncbi:MAG: hypothetical protein ACYDIA_09550 [Candidatus Humimicrobiaceae bacterium]